MFDLLLGTVAHDTSYDLSVKEDQYPKIDKGPAKKQCPDGLIDLINNCVRNWPQD
jgi:hypothetical protein